MAKQEKKEDQKKRSFSLKKVTKYLRELSVVVAGIAITFIASDWISNRNAQKDLASDLEAVRTELEDNLALVREKGGFYERTAKLSHYLSSDYPENLDPDSIETLIGNGPGNVMGGMFKLNYKTSAFETWKSSGSIRVMKDKELSRSILDCYTALQTLKYESDDYMSLKGNFIVDVLYNRENPLDEINILSIRYRRLLLFFANHYDIETSFHETAEQIEETLVLF